jgi:hypothetical protein
VAPRQIPLIGVVPSNQSRTKPGFHQRVKLYRLPIKFLKTKKSFQFLILVLSLLPILKYN